MTREERVEKEVAAVAERMALDAHNKSVLRSMLRKEHDFWEAEAVRQDNYTGRDDQYKQYNQ